MGFVAEVCEQTVADHAGFCVCVFPTEAAKKTCFSFLGWADHSQCAAILLSYVAKRDGSPPVAYQRSNQKEAGDRDHALLRAKKISICHCCIALFTYNLEQLSFFTATIAPSVYSRGGVEEFCLSPGSGSLPHNVDQVYLA